MSFSILLSKENFKFSGTHFTILGPRQAERLHGHNYQVRVRLDVIKLQDDLGLAFDFNLIKPVIKTLCDELDERILVPTKSPYLTVKPTAKTLSLKFADKEYVFPIEDVVQLPLVNITSEELARYFCQRLTEVIQSQQLKIRRVAVSIEETRGQSAIYRQLLDVHPSHHS